MKERPILFSAEMVRAIVEGRKTQTRRIISRLSDEPDSWASVNRDRHGGWIAWSFPTTDEETRRAYPGGGGFLCPYGQAGDTLWVRETCAIATDKSAVMYTDGGGRLAPTAPAGSEAWAREWKVCPSIHMPRWASRIILEVTDVRVERLQCISYEDCCRETGAPLEWPGPGPEPYKRNMRAVFSQLWNFINAKRGRAYSWESNPWVWVVEFERIRQGAE